MILGLTALSDGRIEIGGAAPGSRAAAGHDRVFALKALLFMGRSVGRDQLRHFARLKSVWCKTSG